jgi:hypothetical protein
VIAAYILIQTETGQAAIVAAALRDVPGFFGYIAEMIVGLAVEVSAIRLQRQRSVVKVSSGVVGRPWREHGQGRNQQC